MTRLFTFLCTVSVAECGAGPSPQQTSAMRSDTGGETEASTHVTAALVSTSASDRIRGQERGIWLRKNGGAWEWAEFRTDQTFPDQRMIDAGADSGPRTACTRYEPVSAEAASRLAALFDAPVTDHEARGGSGGTRLVIQREGDERPLRVSLGCDPFDASDPSDATAEGASSSLCQVAERIVALYRSRACDPGACLPGTTTCGAANELTGAGLFGSRECLLPGGSASETHCAAP
jgi:hypothetical protein